MHVVEGHRVFTQLAVTDNLLLAGYGLPRGERAARVEEALAFFPEIAAKRHDRGGALSRRPAADAGGGAGPGAAAAAADARRALGRPVAGAGRPRARPPSRGCATRGTAVLLVEQLIEKALAVADRVYALARGSIVLEARAGEDDLPTGWSMPISAPMRARRSPHIRGGGMQQVATGYGLIEGPVWDPQRGLYFSDVLNGGVFLLDRAGKVSPAVPEAPRHRRHGAARDRAASSSAAATSPACR